MNKRAWRKLLQYWAWNACVVGHPFVRDPLMRETYNDNKRSWKFDGNLARIRRSSRGVG